MLTFKEKEAECNTHFSTLGHIYHICTSEKFELIFSNEEELQAGVGLLGICSKLFPDIKVFTFQIMNNHIHLIVSGPIETIKEYVRLYLLRVQKYLMLRGRSVPLNESIIRTHEIDSLDYFRSAIAYVNRNGFIVKDNCSPYSYPWGANSCFFNSIHKRYYNKCKRMLAVDDIRGLIHSKMADDIKSLYCLDSCVSPFSFCDVENAEKAFRDEKHYFYFVSRNVESYVNIAKIIGEMVSFTDEELYQVASKYSLEMNGNRNPSFLDADLKISLARKLHFDYNANTNQLHRILKIDIPLLDSMF